MEKFREWSGTPEISDYWSRDELLTTISLYWFTGTIGTSFRAYFDDRDEPAMPMIDVPVGVSIQFGERGFPRHYAERTYTDIRFWNDLPSGGHFTAKQSPDEVAADMRTFFDVGSANGGAHWRSARLASRSQRRRDRRERRRLDRPLLPVQRDIHRVGRVEHDEPAAVEQGFRLQVGQHPPAESELRRAHELRRRGHVVAGRMRVGRVRGEVPVLQRVLAVEDQHRRIPESRRREAVRQPALDERRRRARPVAHRPEPGDDATGHGLGIGRDRGHDRAVAQAVERVSLVFERDLEAHVGQRGQGGERPGGERVGVDHQRDDGPHPRTLGAERLEGLALEQRDLPGQPEQDASRLRRLDRLGAQHEHATRPLLEALDPLAHGRGGDVQGFGGALERAVVDDRGEGPELIGVHIHH